MCSLKLYLLTISVALLLYRAKSDEDELLVTYRMVTLNYSVESNEVRTEDEVCREELISNMTKTFLKYMDRTVDPCDNFYKYACGNYGKFHNVSDENHESFIDQRLQSRLAEMALEFLNQSLAENYNLNNADTKALIFYKTCLDTDTMRQRGVQPLKEFIASLGGWAVFDQTLKEDSFELTQILKKLLKLKMGIVLGVAIDTSSKTDVYDVVSIRPGDTFLSKKNSSNSTELMKLKKFFEEVLVLTGVPSDIASETSEDVVNFEVQITKLQFDPHSTERAQNLTLGELESQIPGFNWSELLEGVFSQNLDPQQKVRLTDREYFEGLPILLEATPKRTLANYVFLKVLILFGQVVEAGFENIQNDFQNYTKPLSYEEFCQHGTIDFFSDVINAYFVKNYLKNSTKAGVDKLVEQLRTSFAKTIEENSWLDSQTRAIIQNLLSEMVLLIGHPVEQLSESSVNKKYKDLNVIPDKFFETVLNIVERNNFRQVAWLNKKPNTDEMGMGPTVTGAFYDQVRNEAVITMAMLQPPYYHTYFTSAINFGAMGSLLGHEIAHAVGNNGTFTQEDITVYMNWTKTSAETFDKLAECFVDQFDNYSIYNMSVNGTATLQENMADTTGIRMAFRAYVEDLAQNPSEDNLNLPELNMTDKQLFFLSFAHSECSASSESSINNTIHNDSHSPSEFRVIGTLSNFKEFAETFNCPVGSNMNPLNKCVIW